jgi:hypothetical protein
MGALDYKIPATPEGYRCMRCPATGVKLWRDSSMFLSHIDLYCRDCAEKDQEETIDKLGSSDLNDSDQLGNLVPAVPTVDGSTFWAYTSVPQDGVAWWYSLPTRSSHSK